MVKIMKDSDPSRDWQDGVTERRKWERYAPTAGTLAILDGRSFRMMDISLGGLSIYDYGDETVPEETVVGLHCFDEGYFLDALRCRKVSDHRVVSRSRFGDVVLNRIGLEIIENDPDLARKLTPFMDDSKEGSRRQGP